MPFQKGNKLAKGGKRENAGRHKKQEVEIRKAATVIAREFIEENIKPVLSNYLKLAKGYTETRYTADGQAYDVFVPDGPTTRHFVDKVLPEISLNESTRPIAIQVIVEAAQIPVSANGAGIAIESPRNGGPVSLGDS